MAFNMFKVILIVLLSPCIFIPLSFGAGGANPSEPLPVVTYHAEIESSSKITGKIPFFSAIAHPDAVLRLGHALKELSHKSSPVTLSSTGTSFGEIFNTLTEFANQELSEFREEDFDMLHYEVTAVRSETNIVVYKSDPQNSTDTPVERQLVLKAFIRIQIKEPSEQGSSDTKAPFLPPKYKMNYAPLALTLKISPQIEDQEMFFREKKCLTPIHLEKTWTKILFHIQSRVEKAYSGRFFFGISVAS